MILQKTKNKKGSVLAIMLLVGIIVTILGMGMLAVGQQVRVQAVKASHQTAARVAADAGLTVAIPTLVAYNYFVTRVDNMVLEMEISSSELVELLTKNEEISRR